MLHIAHRGFIKEDCKENSLLAFNNAIEERFDMIEMDIQLTKDDMIIIYHDTHLNGKAIRHQLWEDIQSIHTDIMLLDSFFFFYGDLVNNGEIKLYLDMKGDELLVYHLIEFIQSYSISTEHIYFASFNLLHLTMLRDLTVNYPKPLNLGHITCSKYPVSFYKEIFPYISFFAIDLNIIDNETIRLIKSIDNGNKKVFVFTCHNKEEEVFISNFNVDGIVTNIKLELKL